MAGQNVALLEKRKRDAGSGEQVLGALALIVVGAAIINAATSSDSSSSTTALKPHQPDVDAQLQRQRDEMNQFHIQQRRITERAACSYRGGYWFDGTGNQIGFCSK